ncbi:MAG: hypothetical protein N2109_13585, partial [Fimbriimonadales bacterium]|nr:hypothetical protein [Fimbriimonadales bacterium]
KTYRKALEPEEVKNAMRKTGLYAEEDIAQGTKAYEEFRENLKIKAAGLTPEEASRYIIPDFQTSDISQGLSKAFDGPRGTAHYELIEAIIRPRIKEAFEANGIDLQQDVGVFHWLVWNYFGGQEASHESAIELVRTIVEDDIRFPGITAREARYNVPLHGVEYTISPDFKEICIWRLPSPDGYADKAYVFPVGFYGTLANEIKGIAEKHFLKKNGKKYSIAQLAQNVPYWMERIPGPDGELTDKTYATPRFFAEVERFLDSLVKHGKAEDFVSYGRAALQQIPDWRVIPEPLRRLLDGVDVGPIGGRPKLEAEGGGSHPGGHQDYVVPLSRR